MVKQDILSDGWKWLRSLSDEGWRKEINDFFEFVKSSRKIPFSHSFAHLVDFSSLRRDIEREYESELKTWFCTLDLVPSKYWSVTA